MSPKNKKTDPRIRKFIDFACAGYLNKFGEKMIIGVAEATCIKRLLGSIDLERLKRYWGYFLNYTGDDYILRGTTKDLKGFSGQINRIIQLCPRPRIDKQQKRDIVPKNPQAQKLWIEALKHIKSKIHRESFDTWFAPTQGYDLKGETLQIAVPTTFFANWIMGNYTDLISKALKGRKFELVITEPGE